MDKMTVNCLCYGALGSLLLYPILDELVHGFLRTVIVVLIAVIVGVSLPLYFCYQLCEDIDKQLGYSIWDILEVEKKQEIWSCIKIFNAFFSRYTDFCLSDLSTFCRVR